MLTGFCRAIAKPSQITDKLYLCGESEMGNSAILKCLEIKYILVVGRNLEIKHPDVKFL